LHDKLVWHAAKGGTEQAQKMERTHSNFSGHAFEAQIGAEKSIDEFRIRCCCTAESPSFC
jgi:hypothetical protein